MPELAFEIESGQELEQYQPNQVMIQGTRYYILTGYEGTGRCFWCGKEFDAKSRARQRHYCYGHMREYYRHFEWGSARDWCYKRQEGKCANCGRYCGYKLEVHHIVPLNGRARYFSAFNLPWNLIGLCHDDHQEIHAAKRPPKGQLPGEDIFDSATRRGQLYFEACKVAQD